MPELSSRIKELLLTGCDERIHLDEHTQLNKYFLNPFSYKELLHRGSCTSCTLNAETSKLLSTIDIDTMESRFGEIVSEHATLLKDLLQVEGGCEFEVFFAPSGSDLAYYPLMFQKILYPNDEIFNIVTCPEELGSGTKLASEGKYYARFNQFGEKVIPETTIDPDITPHLLKLPARDDNGNIIDNRKKLRELIQSLPPSPHIVNLVYGSKSGIEDNLHIIDDLKDQDILWTVDLCQFRNSKHLVQELLSKGCLIYLTGSKFYQAPPFCGCMLVPEDLCSKIEHREAHAAKAFQKIFSSWDIPLRFKNIRKHLSDQKNLSLHLRWKCALHEMYKFDNIDENITYSFIDKWNQTVIERLSQSTFFELMPDMELTNKSIISFKVKTGDKVWDYEELWELFQTIVTATYPSRDFQKVFIGQPVKYDSGSFLRLAIGAHNITTMIDAGNEDPFLHDLQLIEIIENQIVQCSKK